MIGLGSVKERFLLNAEWMMCLNKWPTSNCLIGLLYILLQLPLKIVRVCRRNCSCTAYAFADIGIGRKQCLVWDGDLVDLVRFSDEGDDVYVRLASPQTGFS